MYIKCLMLLSLNLNSHYIKPTFNVLFSSENLIKNIQYLKLLDSINIGTEVSILNDNSIYYGIKLEAEKQNKYLSISCLFKALNFQYCKLIIGKTINFYNLTINGFFLKSNDYFTIGINIEKKFKTYKNMIVSININTIKKEFKKTIKKEEKETINFKDLKCLEPKQKNRISLNKQTLIVEFLNHMGNYIEKDNNKKQSFKIITNYLCQILFIENKIPSVELINIIHKIYLNHNKKLLPKKYYIKNINSNFTEKFINFLRYFSNNNKYKMLEINNNKLNENSIPNSYDIKIANTTTKINFTIDINLIKIVQVILTYHYPIIDEKEFEAIIKNALIIENFNLFLPKHLIWHLLNNPNGIIIILGKFFTLEKNQINVLKYLNNKNNSTK